MYYINSGGNRQRNGGKDPGRGGGQGRRGLGNNKGFNWSHSSHSHSKAWKGHAWSKSSYNSKENKPNNYTQHHQNLLRKASVFYAKGCESIEDLIQLAASCKNLQPNQLSAFWSRVPHLLNNVKLCEQQKLKQQLQSILTRTIDKVNEFGMIDLSKTVLGMAKIVNFRQHKTTLFQGLVYEDRFEARKDLFHLFASAAVLVLPSFDAQGLANTAFAYALVDYLPAFEEGNTLFDHIVKYAMQKLGSFNPQNLANIIWACAKLGVPHHSPFFKEVANVVIEQDLASFKPQELKDIVWAYAKAGESNADLFKEVADDLFVRDLTIFKPQDVSTILWAFASAGEFNSQLFKKVAETITARDLKLFNSHCLSNIVWACATAQQFHPHLFEKIASAAITMPSKFDAQATSNLLWAFACTGTINQRLLSSFVPTIASKLGEFNCQHLTNIAWSFAVANVDAPFLFDDEFITALLEKEHEFSTEQLRQLHQWQLWHEELNAGTSLSRNLKQRCYTAFVSSEAESSVLRDDVVSELCNVGMQPQEEVFLTKSGYRVDSLVQLSGEKIGVEVDGPSHFIGKEPNGKTILKRRQVYKIDRIQIVSVPYWEWDQFGNDHRKKQDYLCSKLGLWHATIDFITELVGEE